jgi:hypothetical protein
MDIQAAYEFAKNMRNLARRADTFDYNRQQILEAMIDIAENYEEVAERSEMEMIIQSQRDWVEAA